VHVSPRRISVATDSSMRFGGLCGSALFGYVGDEKRASLARRLYDERAARAVAINQDY